LAGAIFVLALAAVITRPRGVAEAWWAAAGALLMLAVGAVSPRGAATAVVGHWNLFLFLFGLMAISGLADAAGFFDATGAVAAGIARGSGRRLLLATFAAGAVTTAVLSNDATALILTPVVYTVVTRLLLPPLPYLFAATFVANTASMTLPVSNPINVLVGEQLRLPLGSYLLHLLPAAVAAVAVAALLFLAVFWRDVDQRFEIDWRRMLAEAAPGGLQLRLTVAGLAATAAGYLIASTLGLPVGPVAVAGAVLLAALAASARQLQLGPVREHVSLTLLLYVAGLFVMVQGLEEAGTTQALVSGLARLATSPTAAVGVGTVGAAIAANLVNNLPATLFLLSGSGVVTGTAHAPFLVGLLAGADLGPNLTPVGSLSTMLWLVVVRRRGVQVSTAEYLKLGALVTPALLLVSWALIAASCRLWPL
jgi:arsenical pump membrane protein